MSKISCIYGSSFPDTPSKSYDILVHIQGTHMETKSMDPLDIILINIIHENEKNTPAEIYAKVTSLLPSKVSRDIVWSRLVRLVESGTIDLVYLGLDDIHNSEFVFIRKNW